VKFAPSIVQIHSFRIGVVVADHHIHVSIAVEVDEESGVGAIGGPERFCQDVPLAIVQQYLIDQRPVPPFRQHQIKMTVPVQVAKADVGGGFGCLFQQLNTIEAHRRLLSGNSQPDEENDREGEAARLHQPRL
jgi:hypothetical protein